MAYNLAKARQAIMVECRNQGIDDDTRHALLREVGCVQSGSTKDMSADAARRVLDHLRGKSASGEQNANRKRTEWSFVFAASSERQPLLKKLYRIAQAWGKSKAYLEGIAEQMAGGETRLEFCDAARLQALVAACEAQRKREGRRADA